MFITKKLILTDLGWKRINVKILLSLQNHGEKAEAWFSSKAARKGPESLHGTVLFMECQSSYLSQWVATLTQLFCILSCDISYPLKKGFYVFKKMNYMVYKDVSRDHRLVLVFILRHLVKIYHVDLFWSLRSF